MLLLLTLLACHGDQPTLTGIPNLPGGNPVVPTEAMYPFPSDFYLVDDESTHTGRRLDIPAEALPEGMAPGLFSDMDGFSRVPPILTLLRGGVDPSTLPDPSDPSATLDPDSPVLVVREGDWEPVPVLAELDVHAGNPDRQALIIRAHRALDPSTGYVVLLRDGLRTVDGEVHTPTKAFRALRDEVVTDSNEVEAQRDAYELVAEAIEGLGLEREEVVLAWPLHTRSAEQVTGPVLSIHDQVLEASLGVATLDDEEVDGANLVARGSFDGPDYLDEQGLIVLDEHGEPVLQGTREVEFQLTIPDSIVAGPRPVLLFGHGFFSSLEEPLWSAGQAGLQPWGMAAVSTNYLGFNEDDELATIAALTTDLGSLRQVVAQQLQSQANFAALERVIREQLAGEVVVDRGEGAFQVLDPAAIHYYGASNGGTQGLVLLTASPTLSRGVIVVAGGGWSHMLQRAVQWNELGGILVSLYPDPPELQLVLALSQQLLDPADSLNYVDHLVTDRHPGRPPLEVSLHMAVGDCQVANITTEWVARTADIPLITPSPIEGWGLQTASAPPPAGADLDAAFFVYDENHPALPVGNEPPAEDNDTHDHVRKLQAFVDQVGAFLEDGTVVQVCDGACDPD